MKKTEQIRFAGGLLFGAVVVLAFQKPRRTLGVGVGDLGFVSGKGRVPIKRKLWALLLAESGLDTPANFITADARFRNWENKYAKNRGPKPIYMGGELDAPNEYLSLRGDKRLSGTYEAFVKLTPGVKTWDDLARSDAIGVLNEVPGLQRLRLPEFVMEMKQDSGQHEFYRQQQEEFEEADTLMDMDTVADLNIYDADVPF